MSNNFWHVNQCPRNEKSPSFASFACSTFQNLWKSALSHVIQPQYYSRILKHKIRDREDII